MVKSVQDMVDYLEDTAQELSAAAQIDNLEAYRLLTEVGAKIPPLEDGDLIDENFVIGCISNVYIAHRCESGIVYYRGSAESHVVKGYVAILIEALSGLPAEAIVQFSGQPIQHFAETTNIRATLTPSRANAFANIYTLMIKKARSCLG